MDHTTPYSTRRGQRGFTLTELLVATSIFLILTTALVTLFNSAVFSARAGYASIDAYEQGRMAMSTISRDLSQAFTRREHGDVYNFYGRHDGFMFVGALDNGEIGRVTYAFHPEAASDDFQTEIQERWGQIRANVHRQASRVFREAGLSGNAVVTEADAVVDALRVEYGLPAGYPPDEYVTLNVLIQTESLIRVEEAGVTSLDHFDMRVTAPGVNPPEVLNWPNVDPGGDPDDDPAPADADQSAQLDFLLGALNPNPGSNTTDLRRMYTNINSSGGWPHPVTGDELYLRVLGRDTFARMLDARKREFWVRMLSGDPMGVPALQPDTDPANENGSWGYWYDEGFNATNGNARQRRTVNEFVVADGIIRRAVVFDAAGADPLFIDVPVPGEPDVPLDALDAAVKFSYGDGANQPVHHFNDLVNLRNPDDPNSVFGPTIPSLVNNASGTIFEGDLVQADNQLADNLLGVRSTRRNMGSILAPRIPEVVTPQFWLTRSKRRPGGADFRRLFVQSIQVPAAAGRDTGSAIALGPGGSL